VRGIETKLADLAQSEQHRPFVTELGAYVQAFDLDGYMTYLNRFSGDQAADG
jgi:hypothetical protein